MSTETKVALTKAEAIAVARADWATRNAVVERIVADRLEQAAQRVEAMHVGDYSWGLVSKEDAAAIVRGES